MIKPSLLASLNATRHPEERDGNPAYLRDTVLQSQTTLRIQGWSKGNLLRSIAHRGNQTFSLFVFGVDHIQNGEMLLHLGTKESLSLKEALDADSHRNSPLSVFILYCNSDEFDEVLRHASAHLQTNTMFVIVTGDQHYFYFALACELTHWWELVSCVSNTVTFEHIGRCMANIAEAYPRGESPRDCKIAIICEPQYGGATAWNGGHKYAQSVDIETFRDAARDEQLADTLKRMSDAANYPRQQHFSSEERMISSQGLFWLAEASSQEQMATWLRDTRLYRECHPNASENTATILVRELEQPHTSFFLDFFTHFVHVPAGTYPFGSNDESLDSEPPARHVNLDLRSFSIMRSPVTYGFLRHFMHCDVSSEMNEFPVTNVTYFDAEYIARICSSLLQRVAQSSQSRYVVRLPTEYQWEAAARGTDLRNYPWGTFFDERVANYGMRIGHPTPVGMFSPKGDSLFGCQDMAGNVREWTRSYGGTRGIDWTTHEQRRVLSDERPILDSSRLIIKGGSYSYSVECLQTWVRNTQIANRRDSQTGFRLVLEELDG